MLKVNEISGFVSQSPEVIIEKDGMPFYKQKRKSRFITFNLPEGNYNLVKGFVTKKNVIDYPLIKLPVSRESGILPKKIEVKFITNKNKCSVDISDKKVMKIWFDKSFLNYPDYVRNWIKGHEAGHYLYSGSGVESEKNCDLFACNVMLVSGYNPSQIQSAIDCSLSNHLISEHRKDCVHESLQHLEKEINNIQSYEHGN